MVSKIREMVSKERRRYKEDGHNLDLSYILPNVIAMGFPAEKFEAVYRNDIDDVARMLREKHKDGYWVYNLCEEKDYDDTIFGNRVERFPIYDHETPKLMDMLPFCRKVDQWLKKKEGNVAAIHCKAGKGRTGIMICAYLLFSGHCRTAEEALNFYAERRTKDTHGVTIPSQRRCVHDFAKVIRCNCRYESIKMRLKSIWFDGSIMGGNCPDGCTVIIDNEEIFRSDVKSNQNQSSCLWKFKIDVEVQDDVRIVFNKTNLVQKEKLFSVTFNTFMICPLVFSPYGADPGISGESHHNSDATGDHAFADRSFAIDVSLKDVTSGNAVESAITNHDDCAAPRHHCTWSRNQLDIVRKKNRAKHFSEDFQITCMLQCFNPAHRRSISTQESRDTIGGPISPTSPIDRFALRKSSPVINHSTSSSSLVDSTDEDDDEPSSSRDEIRSESHIFCDQSKQKDDFSTPRDAALSPASHLVCDRNRLSAHCVHLATTSTPSTSCFSGYSDHSRESARGELAPLPMSVLNSENLGTERHCGNKTCLKDAEPHSAKSLQKLTPSTLCSSAHTFSQLNSGIGFRAGSSNETETSSIDFVG